MRSISRVLSPIKLAVLDISQIDDFVYLITRINVPEGFRGRGVGRQLFQQLLDSADAEEVALVLEINPYGELDYAQLEAWYHRMGFKTMEAGYLVRQPPGKSHSIRYGDD